MSFILLIQTQEIAGFVGKKSDKYQNLIWFNLN